MNGLLIIDDDEGVRRALVRALKREPFVIHVTESGEDAVSFLQDHAASISTVICDFKMPGMNGIETLDAIGRRYPEITRILLTAYATMDMAIDAVNQGVDGFLTKPFDNVDLRNQIREIQTRKRLRQFVSEEVYKEIAVAPDALRPRFQEASILFADIRGFTAMSRNRNPEEIADFLNRHYFGPMGEIVYEHHGVTDKWIGDSIMAVFGVFGNLEAHADQAVKAGVAMQNAAAKINREIAEGPFRLEIGIGIASGNVFTGVLGSLRKKEFSSIGMPVNLASRLQRVAKTGEIWISAQTKQWLHTTTVHTVSVQLKIKGFEEPLEAYRATWATS